MIEIGKKFKAPVVQPKHLQLGLYRARVTHLGKYKSGDIVAGFTWVDDKNGPANTVTKLAIIDSDGCVSLFWQNITSEESDFEYLGPVTEIN